MAGTKWSLWRRFKKLSLWNKFFVIIGILSFIIGLLAYVRSFSPVAITLSATQIEQLKHQKANPLEVSELLNSIQKERNESINESAQVEFIDAIANIYRTISPDSNIILNETVVDSLTQITYRSDIIIEKEVAGIMIKLLFRLNPYENPIGNSEIISFQNHIEKINASKGILITKGNYKTSAIKTAKKSSIDLATFSDSKSNEWDNELEIPVLIRMINVDFNSSTKSEIVTKSGSIAPSLIEISFDGGKSKLSMLEIFRKKWNNKELNDSIPGKYKFDFSKNKSMKIRLSNKDRWVTLEELSYEYVTREEYRFKYLTAKEFIKLKNITSDKLIYSQYTFGIKLFDNISTWPKVSNLTKHLRTISNELRLDYIGGIEENGKNVTLDKVIILKNSE